MKVELTKEFYIEAAHRNPRSTGVAARLHGHSFQIEVMAAGEVDPAMGWLVDYKEIKEAFAPLERQLDHHCLNDVEGLEHDPTQGGLTAWLKQRLAPSLPLLSDVRVSIVGDNAFKPRLVDADPARSLPRRWRFTFEAAQYLPQLPPDHPCSRLHGHTYRIEVGATDLERLRPGLRRVYDALDHRCLNDIPGLDEATSERLCKWLWQALSEEVDDLRVVIVQETNTARCAHYG